MKIKHAALLLVTPLALNSCKLFHKSDDYDTGDTLDSSVYDSSNPYGIPGVDSGSSSSHAATPPVSSNPTYSSAAYEDHSEPVKSSVAKVKASAPVKKVAATTTKATAKTKAAVTTTKSKVTTKAVATKAAASKAVAKTAAKTTKAVSTKSRVHTVTSGDSLWTLSRKYNVSAEAIKKANGLKKDTIITGSKLIIPAR